MFVYFICFCLFVFGFRFMMIFFDLDGRFAFLFSLFCRRDAFEFSAPFRYKYINK